MRHRSGCMSAKHKVGANRGGENVSSIRQEAHIHPMNLN